MCSGITWFLPSTNPQFLDSALSAGVNKLVKGNNPLIINKDHFVLFCRIILAINTNMQTESARTKTAGCQRACTAEDDIKQLDNCRNNASGDDVAILY